MRGGGLVVGGLEVLDGVAGGFGLLGVASGLVPASGEDHGPDKGGDQDGEGAAVLAAACVHQVTGGGTQTGRSGVVGADLGALGADERPCGGSKFGAEGFGRGLGGGLDQFAEGGDLGLGSCVTTATGLVAVAGVDAEGVEGVGGTLPGGAGPVAAGGGVFLGLAGFEEGLEFGQ